MTPSAVRFSSILLMSAWLVSCGESMPLPTQPSPAASAPTLRAVIDGLPDATAIVGISTVDFESETRPVATTSRLDFGDGDSAADASTSHVYRTPGTFTATLTVTDAGGRSSLATTRVVARALTVSLQEAPGDGSDAQRFDFRSQDEAAVTGVYTSAIVDYPRPFVAEIERRHVTIIVDGLLARFDCTIPATFGTGRTSWLVAVLSADRHSGTEGTILRTKTLNFVETP